MKEKFRRYLVSILTLCIVLGGVSFSNASSNHLLIINSNTNKMGYFVNYKLVKEFRVATGKSSSQTPQGKTKVVNKIKNRPYYSGGIPGGDPRNPLGDRWLGLNLRGTYGTTYGIHGNNNESSIGKHVSGGCIRMHNSEVRWLFDKVPVGTDVIIKNTTQTYEQIAASYGIKLNANEPGWKKENNKWYYIKDDRTYQKNGWLKIKKKWYYFDKTGVMQTGWEKVDNKWYYLNEDGSMRTGWAKIDNKWYYLNEDGSMRTGWAKVDNKWYYLNEDGSMKTDWKKVDNKWYYFNTDGIMQTGWKTINNVRYYLYSDGSMAVNTVIDGITIDKDGIAK